MIPMTFILYLKLTRLQNMFYMAPHKIAFYSLASLQLRVIALKEGQLSGDTSSSANAVRGSPGTLIPNISAVKPKASQSTDNMICGP
jgi:hypothetical protein